jgi:hypothetical protein
MTKLLAFAALVASAAAMCPGDSPCSGHGSCGTFDRCTCYRNWQGKDCSERVCPYITSWNEAANNGAETIHSYTECGSKGLCDRKAGECKCFDGFTGVGCRRMSCDDDCSGHGTCETIGDAASYTGWDSAMITQCVCDPGYEGVNCASRMCKKGDDPMTLTTTDSGSATFQVNEVQTLTISGTRASGDNFAITYTDWRGNQFTTWAIDAVAPTVISIEEALVALPNLAIPSVTVTLDTTCASGSACVFDITFSDSLNAGDQADLVVDQTACASGCQPLLVGSAGSFAIATPTPGTKEWNTCSDRGTCNGDTGDCECFDGYTGQACEIQTIIT